ncbi:DDE-type integrase/transposase/recombinase OS=Streptomyces rimosus subsp. rimosus (strain ATCC / DSM 40260 / JCM 4667 / NRRL 2234) OX=1265868 GN=SRIM_005365 PE=4 SV=1 [Streptomyces rimosus subsp. rimosus]
MERLNRTLLDEWAYVRPYSSNAERTEALTDFLHTSTATGATPHSTANHPSVASTTQRVNTTSATEQPDTAVRNLLAGRTVARHEALPYFWSDQYGARLQLAGRPGPQDAVRVVEGDPGDRGFLAVYERDGRTTAVFAVDRPRPFMRLRRRLATGPPGPHGLSGPPAEPAGAPGAAFWPCCSAASAHRCAAPTPGA